MSVSIVIPHYGDGSLLDSCLTAIQAGSEDLEAPEVVVVDNNEQNRGFAAGCNLGATRAEGSTLVFLNNDTQPQAGWLEPLQSALWAEWPIAGSLLTYPTGKIQHAGVELVRYPGHILARNITTPRPSGLVDAVTGACLAINRSLFFELGGFDEGYWNGYEDVDLCLKATAHQGKRCWLAADSHVIHHESQSGPERWKSVRENIARLNDKWGN